MDGIAVADVTAAALALLDEAADADRAGGAA
jgi:hypothetical protein